jgi:hypothetical protein
MMDVRTGKDERPPIILHEQVRMGKWGPEQIMGLGL